MKVGNLFEFECALKCKWEEDIPTDKEEAMTMKVTLRKTADLLMEGIIYLDAVRHFS